MCLTLPAVIGVLSVLLVGEYLRNIPRVCHLYSQTPILTPFNVLLSTSGFYLLRLYLTLALCEIEHAQDQQEK